MPNDELTVVISADIYAAIQEAVAVGGYASESEVVSEAVMVWLQSRREGELDAKKLLQLWNEGIASGPSEPLDMAAIKREGRRRLKELQAADR